MTNRERLLQDGSNCPYYEPMKMPLTQRVKPEFCKNSPYGNVCTDWCRTNNVVRLSRTAKGRRWLDDECADQ